MSGSFTELLLSKKLCSRPSLRLPYCSQDSGCGVALGARDTPVVCLTGDGCFLMSGQEITVAVEERLPVIFVVLNDHAYGMIKHAHRLAGTEPVDFAIPPVDFCQMAQAV